MTDLEVEPAAAAEVFGPTIDKARAFTTALAEHGEERGLIGPSNFRGCGPATSSTALSPHPSSTVASVTSVPAPAYRDSSSRSPDRTSSSS